MRKFILFLILFIFSGQEIQAMSELYAADIQPLGFRNGFRLIFNDEFNGTAVDLVKWQPNWFGAEVTTVTNPVNSNEQAAVDPAQSTVANGQLIQTAIYNPITIGPTTYQYRSGLLSSNGKFEFAFGYFEARIWVPGGATMENWPAFWADGQNWPFDGEIDVMEGLAGDAYWHFHYNGGDPGGIVPMVNPGSWHVYAADWRANSITFYYDGVQVGQVSQNITASPMYLIINLGVSSIISPPVIVPSTMKVDYVRVWKRTKTGRLMAAGIVNR